MENIKQRLDHEIEHGKKLATEGAEDIWNWASPAGQKRADRRAALIAEVGKIQKGNRVLEIGCGTGLFSRKVQELTGADIFATDLSDELLHLAKQHGTKGVTYLKDDAMRMQFADNSFDVVFGSSILHHLNFEASLAEIYRVLKPGGKMVFAEPNMLNPQILIQKNVPFIKKALGDSPDESAIIRWKYAKLMGKVGFKNVNIFPYDFLHPSTPRFLVPTVDRISRVVDKIPVIKEIAGSVIIYGEK
jgi:ubiquinone/menaquinone biosynthesis C-methylase UbiE